MVGVETPHAVEWQRANFVKRGREDADPLRKGSVPLLSVTTRFRSLAAGAGVSAAAVAGLIAMAITLGGIFGFRVLPLFGGSDQGPALHLPPGLGVAATPGGVPLPVLRLAAVTRGAAAAAFVPAPARHLTRHGGHGPAGPAPAPVAPVATPPAGSGGGSAPAGGSGGSTAPPAPPAPSSGDSGPVSTVAKPVSTAVSTTTQSTGSAVQPVSPAAAQTVAAVGQTAAQTVDAVAQTVDSTLQSVTGGVAGATGSVAGAVKLP